MLFNLQKLTNFIYLFDFLLLHTFYHNILKVSYAIVIIKLRLYVLFEPHADKNVIVLFFLLFFFLMNFRNNPVLKVSRYERGNTVYKLKTGNTEANKN